MIKMQKYVTATATLAATIATTPALAHFTGVPHEAGAGHPVFGIDHLFVVLAVGAVVGAAVVWARRL